MEEEISKIAIEGGEIGNGKIAISI